MADDAITAGEVADFRSRLRTVEGDTADNKTLITSHEQVCAERYRAINLRLNLLVVIVGAIAAGQWTGVSRALPGVLKLLGLG